MYLRSVGTRGGCGERWGPGACPHGIRIPLRCDEMRREVREPGESCRHEDKHKAPTSSPLIPLSLQDGDAPPSLPHSVGKVHQDDEEDYPDSVGTIHQDATPLIPPFGCHSSSGRGNRPIHHYPIRLSKIIRSGNCQSTSGLPDARKAELMAENG